MSTAIFTDSATSSEPLITSHSSAHRTHKIEFFDQQSQSETRYGRTIPIMRFDSEPYRVIETIRADVYPEGEGWIAVFEDADIAFAADDAETALEDLKKEILDALEDFEEIEAAGKLDQRSKTRLQVLRRHITR